VDFNSRCCSNRCAAYSVLDMTRRGSAADAIPTCQVLTVVSKNE